MIHSLMKKLGVDHDHDKLLQLKSWGSHAPKTYNNCVHELVHERARTQPEAPAICSWDGQFTYAELDSLSTSLARHLVDHGVGPEIYVPIYSEKSRWVPVAMLAVLKAGGAFVLLDPSHPISRLEEMCRAVSATKIITSKQNAERASRLAPESFITGDHISPQTSPVKTTVNHSNVAYVVFTSGSSGRPKAVAIEHGAFCSSAMAHATATNISATSRVLQFASYAFDACLTEMLTALIVGACICIPSEEGRTSDLAGEAHRLKPNWALLTPSVARILDVTDFSTLQTLVLGGEAISAEDVHKWAPHLSLYVAYGVSEAAVINLARQCKITDIDHANLGFGVGVTCWVVDPEDHNQLAAVGAVGELVLDGPTVGREYLNDPSRTAESFIDPPPWHHQLKSDATTDKASSKLYKTGDLCAHNPVDGSLRYVGRKDDQKKLRGQRLEVAEVEHSLRPFLLDAHHIVVDVVKIDGLEILVAFVLPETQSVTHHVVRPDEPWLLEPNEAFSARTKAIQQQLRGIIPEWMIPGVFLALKYMPLMPSGKSDRRTLRSLAAGMNRHQLQLYGAISTPTTKRAPSTSMEKLVQQLWASVLRVPASDIGLDDNFMELGGTSIHVMKLAGAARQKGLVLTVRDVFLNGSLAEMAASLKPATTEAATSILPFALIPETEDRDMLINRAVQICNLRDRSQIEDIYPCTPLQEGLMSLTARRSGAYTVAFEYVLPGDVDISRFQRAWDTVMDANPIMRTRFMQSTSGTMYQVVVREPCLWETVHDWEMGLPLLRFHLRHGQTQHQPYQFSFIFHHAISDGWALPLLLQQVQAAYDGAVSLPARPFNLFIDYISKAKVDYEAFWNNYYADLQAATFPSLPSVTYTPKPTTKKTFTIQVEGTGKNEYSVPNRLKLAWGILISLYTDSPDTVFGVTVAGRGAPVLGIEDMTGPTIASIPYRLNLQSDKSVSDTLRKVHDDSVAMIPFEQAGLQYISRMGSEAAMACYTFQSLFIVQPSSDDAPLLFRSSTDLSDLDAFSTYAITLICRQLPDSVEIDVTFDPKVVEETQLDRMVNQMRHIFQQLNPSQSDLAIRDLDITSPEDWAELTQWNKNLPDPVRSCAHDLIRKQCELRPQAPAVFAWDGNFTYAEVDTLSSDLAAYLMEQGVGPEVFIPLCFEKTRWTTIAMLGVIKAGGAFVLLDPSHPVQRLQDISCATKAPFVISSDVHAGLASKLTARSIIIGKDWKPSDEPKTLPLVPNPAVSPENSIYAVFTSGSTGTPKGAIHSHISWCTSAEANRVSLYLEPTSRVFQFASYAFDISIADNLLTLLAGGCVCVPKNEDIHGGNLAMAINDLGANWACITPSVARIIDPSKVPDLKMLALCGEPIASEVISLWLPYAHLLNVYGPAECAILTTVNREIRDFKDPNNVAFPTSAVCWVVDAHNENRLAPIGSIGELLVESPIVGHGYLNDPERSAESFISSDKYPKWLPKFRPGGSCRLYRTGDLVQYIEGGALRYMGRSGTQIKLRGQRVELGEVEHHLRQCFPEAQEVVAEVISRKTGPGGSVLMAFILPKPQIFKMSDEKFHALAAEATRQLELQLPTYMVPSVFIPVDQLPYSKSGKLDRKLLRSMAAQLGGDEYTKPAPARKVEPVSDEERELLGLFSQALRVPAEKMSTTEHFVKLGGDSLVAMNLVALAKDRGLLFSTTDIFKNPTISSLAKIVRRRVDRIENQLPPLSLIRNDMDRQQIETDATNQCGVHRDNIEDIYPCTPLQEGLMSLSAKTPGMYIARFTYTIPQDTDLLRLQNAWNKVIQSNSILRTRIIESGSDGVFQVVLKDLPPWETFETIEDQDIHSKARLMTLGSPLVYLSLAPMIDASQGHRLLLTIHHSLYDGWSLPLLWQQALKAYDGQEIIPQSFNRFIQHVMQIDGRDKFWEDQMSDLNAAQFPSLPQVDYIPDANQSLTHAVADLPDYKGEHTFSAMVQLAWAIVISHYTDSEDVVFGQTSNGRTASVEGIAEITGPTIATFPVRVSLDMEKTIEDSLLDLQQQIIATIPFMQSGLHNIRRINGDTAKACDFQTQIVLQPPSVTAGMDLGRIAFAEEEDFEDYTGFASYAFVMLCHMRDGSNNLDITVNYDSSVLLKEEAQRLVEQFHGVLRQLLEKQSRPIREIDIISKEDLTQLAVWNKQLPHGTYETLHDLVFQHCRDRPEAQAVSGWDGSLTYRELDDISARLAQHLLTFGLQAESKVIACLEKSCWSIVALMAILRAGCTCILVDPGHPRGRIEEIIARSSPELMVVSANLEKQVQGLVSRAVFLSSDFISGLPPLSVKLPTVLPTQAAFIIFTSGSTGTPKGIVMEHVNLSTSVASTGAEMRFGPESRCLHFSSYAFDASIYEILNTLIFGGCLCVVSEHDRMNNLISVIRDQRINHAIFTPSTLALMEPEDISSIKSLVVGGEALTNDVVNRWAKKVSLINGYGPAESTICSVHPVPPTGWRFGTIGPIMGGHGWIVDRSNHNKLAAIGAVGELIVEGPVVTRGYLNEPEKTAEAYIKPPEWLLNFRSPGTQGRLYKSGDLVQYNPDGTLRFFGRKGSQIKLRGQRIELGEVEYHVKKAFPVASEVVVEVVTLVDGGRPPFLVAGILAGQKSADDIDGLFLEPTQSFLEMSQQAKDGISNSVPSYMVPEVFLPLRRLPLSRSLKLDRRQFREACSRLSLNQLQEYSAQVKVAKRAPSTDIERTLQKIWARVLNIDAASIGVDDNWMRLGGDSIQAMRVVAQCTAAGLKTSVMALFRGKTIALMSQNTEYMNSTFTQAAERENIQFALSPIQKMFFDKAGSHYDHFNKNLLFRLSKPVSSESVQRAIQWIVSKHSMFRARFSQSSKGQWKQMIVTDTDSSYSCPENRVNDWNEATALIQIDQESLDIKEGPLLICHSLVVGQENQTYLSLTAHGLVVDSASWKIILSDLEVLLTGQRMPTPPSLSFQAWSQLQAKYAAKNLHPDRVLFNRQSDVPPVPTDYWEFDPSNNTWEDVIEDGFVLSEQVTQALLGNANDAFKTQPVEILHAVLLQAFAQVFADRPVPTFFSEGDGRDPWDSNFNPSRTVGWFTTLWPACVSVQHTDSLMDIVRKTKDSRRQVKDNGWAYFTSLYHHPEGASRLRMDESMEILFNYRPEVVADKASLLQPATPTNGKIVQTSPKMTRFSLVDVLAEVSGSRLSFNFIYNQHMRHGQSSIRDWIEQSKRSFESASVFLAQQKSAFTTSDFPLLKYSYSDLEVFSESVAAPLIAQSLEIEDAYKCSPIQDGMLLSLAKAPGQYMDRFRWSVKLRDDSPVQPEKLQEAWDNIMQRHPLLRTVLYENPGRNGHYDQLVLKRPPPGMSIILPTSEDPVQQLEEHQFHIPPLSPPHRLAICASPYGDVECLLEINHAVIDGYSTQVLLRDLGLAYEGKLDLTPRRSYRDYVEYIGSRPKDEAMAFWERYLQSVESCNLPPSPPCQVPGQTSQGPKTLNVTLPLSPAIREFTSKHEMTLAKVFQLAWALVLRSYVNSESACFGYMTSGRDVPIANIDDTIGPVINMHICRIDMAADDSILDLLDKNQENYVQSLMHQHISITDKMKAAKLSASTLFNTIMSVQSENSASQTSSALLFGEIKGANYTEYDVVLNIGILEHEIDVSWEYSRTFISEEQVENLSDAFQQALMSIVSKPTQKVRNINLLGHSSRHRIRQYNSQEPQPVDELVDQLIEKRCLAQPSAQAVNAWDGNFTYAEVNSLSDAIAAGIINRGIGRNKLIPLYFEKSCWTVIAMLGVLKAGSAFILLETSHPVERLQDICRDAEAPIVISTVRKIELARQLVSQVYVVDAPDVEPFEHRSSDKPLDDSHVRSTTDVAYVIFTSGSTGKPKGVMIPHRAFATSSAAHGNALMIGSDSRVLQLASYAFDVAVLEHLTTLIAGGCICIPSDTQKQDIARSVSTFQANWALFTPPVARVLDPSDFKTLHTLVLGGESIAEKELNAWRSHVNLFLAYGPSECAIVSSAQMVTKDVTDGRNLGHCLGSCGWIVNPNDPDQLVPIGAVGELLIEGPIVGLGYLNDIKKTNATFIEPPRWFARLRNKPPGRLYRTGDLVRYVDNGVIQFVGRKDFQVKIRGNRIELGEIESRLREAFPGVRDSTVEVVKPTDGRQPMIVAFVCLDNGDSQTDKLDGHTTEDLFMTPTLEFSIQAQNAEAQMSKSLPSYMIPVVYLPLRYMPLTGNGKLDRKTLGAMAALLSPAQLEKYDFSTKPNEMPKTADEILLQQIWARVLDKDPSSIGLHSNFFRLGGDSISAMQVASQCSAIRNRLTVADIFTHKTIAKLSTVLLKPIDSSYPPDKIGTPFDLSPTQRIYFEAAPQGDHHFNISSFHRITKPIATDQLQNAILTLAQRHSMLTARFSKSQDGEWTQTITSDVVGSYRCKHHTVQTIESADSILSNSELAISPQKGPLLVADLIDVAGSEQYLFIACHRLVADSLSLQIILGDLEAHLTSGSMSEITPFPFQTWCTLQKDYAAANLDPEHSRLDNQIPEPPADYWGVAGKSDMIKDTSHTEFTLSQDATMVLKEAAGYAFKAKLVELLQAVLIHSFTQTFRDRSPVSLYHEGHGREPWTPQIDLSATVGNFTTEWPLAIPIQGYRIFDVIIRVKDRLRTVRDNGWAHFASCLHPNAKNSSNPDRSREVTFKFASSDDEQLETSGSLFQTVTRPQASISDVSDDIGRSSIIDIMVQMKDDRLSFDFAYNMYAAENRPIIEWITNCKKSLEEMVDQLPLQPVAFTLADFPLLPFTYRSLEKFTRSLEDYGIPTSNVENVYPCSPIQRGILLSQAKVAGNYQTQLVLKIGAIDSSSAVDVNRVIAAWQKLIARHPIFRTVFVESIFPDNVMDQVLLKCVSAELTVIPSDEESNLLSRFSRDRMSLIGNGKLPYRITFAQTLTGDVLCRLEMNHALYDGTTRQIIMAELHSAYQGTLPSDAGPQYSDYISYLSGQSKELQNEYWSNYLKDVTPCHLPSFTESEAASPGGDVSRSIELYLEDSSVFRQFCQDNELTIANVCQVAWGILLKRYTNSDAVCFGYISQGRDVPIPNATDAMGPFINMLVCRMDLSNSTSLMNTLRANQTSFAESLKHQHYSLANILRTAQVQSGEPLFNTAFSLQTVRTIDPDKTSLAIEYIDGDDPSEYDLVFHVLVSPDQINLTLVYVESFVSEELAGCLLDSLSQTIRTIIAKPDATIGAIDVVGERSRQVLHKWAGTLPPRSPDLIQDVVHQRCLAQPDKTAVDAWDGQFTYRQVDELSSRLALHIAQYTFGPDTFIPVCFEKSKWVPVIMLAILKSGAAFILLDPSQPSQRLEYICRTAKASVAVASEDKSAMAATFAQFTITVGDQHQAWVDAGPRNSPSTSPDNVAFAVFTSGSTGKPKGVQTLHSAFVTSVREHGPSLGFTPNSRVLQFSSHAFDASIAENLTTLMLGGCVCIPSDEERKQSLPEAFARMQVNWFFITPALARVLDPNNFPSLKTVILGGDLITEKELSLWRDKVDLRLAYGPAECTPFATVMPVTEKTKGRNLGTTMNCRSWVVDPNDHERLLPVGAVGELILEGPTVGRGYINEPEKTAAVFIEQPAWMNAFNKTPSRIYKTGDLVKYSPDGTLYFISRKDNQIKIRGQRLELGEVEYHVRDCYPRPVDVTAELLVSNDPSRGPVLVAFIYGIVQEPSKSDEILAPPSPEFCSEVQNAEGTLSQRLPSYMVPTIYLPLQRMPLNASGKVDRQILRQRVSTLSQDDIGLYNAATATKTPPINDKERELQMAWSKVLNIASIGREDNWFRLGGDSLTAMTLIPLLREAGYNITMADIFKTPKLADLASASVPINASARSTIPPFSLMCDLASKESLIELASTQCGLSADDIEDVYPTTSLQEGLVALAAKQPGHYIASSRYELAKGIDSERFMSAWNATAAANAILRTRIIQSDSLGSLQVVVRDFVPWHTFDDEQAYEAHIEAISLSVGNQLVDIALIQPKDQTQEGFLFCLTIHHALYDGGSLPLLWSQVQSAYQGESLSPSPFNRFIEYVLDVKGADTFWKSEFRDLQAPVFPALPSSNYIPNPNTSLTHTMPAIGDQFGDFTAASAIRLAWAIVMSCYTDSDDILYGLTVNGRSCPVDRIEDITGPTFATFPVRTQLNQDHTVQDSLARIQEKTAEMMAFQQFGIQNIRRLSPDAARACQFQCHFAVQAPAGSDENELIADHRSKEDSYEAFSSYALVVVCHLPSVDEADIVVSVSYDKQIVEPLQAQRMMKQFEHILRQIKSSQSNLESQSIRLRDFDLLCPEDRDQLTTWNSVIPPSVDSCLHELVLQHAINRPDAPAICAWDGEMTYKELDIASAILAQQLQTFGIQPGSRVPLLFDRSKWVIVSMIAIHRIGAACINIDPTHPKARIQDILDRTQARFALASPTHGESMIFMNTELITVPIQDEEPRAEDLVAPQVSPADVAFVIFTSGSTGKPKGILAQHANLTTSIRGYSADAYLDHDSRVLHFASYAFDAAIYEIFGALMNGGCICIPNELDRINDVVPFVNEHNVNWALFTPSYLALLEPASIPRIRTILIGGEAISTENVLTWGSKVRLVTGYGPAEATICAAGLLTESNWIQGSLGHITGGVGWVTMPSDRSRLAPIGTPGELVLEGNVVTLGYIGDPEKTAASYATNPLWLRPFRQGHPESRVYFSGDLAQYNADGTIRFLGRADTQVKLRGQRIELGEVEHHVRDAFPNVTDVVAEVVKPNDGAPILIAFVVNDMRPHSQVTDKLFGAPTEEFLAQSEAAARSLAGSLPGFMVPSLLVQLPEIPRTSSDKANRKLLRELAAKLSPEQIEALSNRSAPKRKPTTERELVLRSLWAQVFKISPDSIGADDNFLNFGDSIAAIRLSGIARRQGFHLPVSQIFEHPILSAQALALTTLASSGPTQDYLPGSLLGITSITDFFTTHLADKVLPYKADDVEDILPTTLLQSALLHGKNVTYSRLPMSTKVDPLRLEEACRVLLRKHALLRTVFVPYRDDIVQVVLRDASFRMQRLECDEDLLSYSEKWCSKDYTSPVPFGSLHFQPTLISRSESDHILVIRMTHAQYDAVSFPIISKDLTSAYSGIQLDSTAPSFAQFLHYRQSQNSKELYAFWREHLAESEMTTFETPLRRPDDPDTVVKFVREVPLPTPPEGITMASFVKAVWSVLLARTTKRKDVVFGHVIGGRDIPLANVDVISGPCITMSPFRVSTQAGWTVRDLFDHVQSQYTRSMEYANIDFKSIREHATSWPSDTDFGSVLTHHQAVNTDLTGSIGDTAASDWKNLDFSPPAHFHLVTLASSDKLWISLTSSTHKMRANDVELLMYKFCELAAQFSEDSSLLLKLD